MVGLEKPLILSAISIIYLWNAPDDHEHGKTSKRYQIRSGSDSFTMKLESPIHTLYGDIPVHRSS